MTTIAEVRDGIAQAITEGTGLRTMSYVSSSVPHPCAYVRFGPYDPRLVLGRGTVEYQVFVTVFLGPVSERAVSLRADRIREMTGDESIVAALESTTLLPAGVHYATVTMVGAPEEAVVAEEALMTVEFEIEVVF